MTDQGIVGSGQVPPGFPQTLEDAKNIFSNTRSQDPFPGIAPALLNSADIFDYARKTGMVFPFIQSQLKSASYSIRIGDRIIYWDEKGDQINKHLDLHEPFCLPTNSIVFIKTEEIFLLPCYIAMRFNLKIDKVHKGILLGTGPLVDPGFEGHLLIPLHNLTTNKYYLYRGQVFVWVEFTKTSENNKWVSEGRESHPRNGNYVDFPDRKKWLTPTEYLNDAHEGEIRSSLPPELEIAQQSAKRANIISLATALTGLAIIVGMLATGFIGGAAILQGVNSRVDAIDNRLDPVVTKAARVDGLAKDLRSAEQHFDSHESEVAARANRLGRSIDQLREEIQQLRQKVDRLEVAPTQGELDRTQP